MTSLAGGAQPTVIAPQPYADRLLRALDRYFVRCPNKWSAVLATDSDKTIDHSAGGGVDGDTTTHVGLPD